MAMTLNVGYTNTTASTQNINPTKLGKESNYAATSETASEVRMSNLTCPADQAEIISYRYRNVSNINIPQGNMYPPEVSGGIEYGVKLDDLLSLTDSTVPSFRVDYPMEVTLTIKHPKSKYITKDVVIGALQRTLGALCNAAGEWDIERIMRGSLEPKAD